jgi:hypothetical protein
MFWTTLKIKQTTPLPGFILLTITGNKQAALWNWEYVVIESVVHLVCIALPSSRKGLLFKFSSFHFYQSSMRFQLVLGSTQKHSITHSHTNGYI